MVLVYEYNFPYGHLEIKVSAKCSDQEKLDIVSDKKLLEIDKIMKEITVDFSNCSDNLNKREELQYVYIWDWTSKCSKVKDGPVRLYTFLYSSKNLHEDPSTRDKFHHIIDKLRPVCEDYNS
jgi:hypothetical protein